MGIGRKFSRSVARTVCALAFTCAASANIAAEGLAGDHMTVLGLTSQPIGHYLYCQQNPKDCILSFASPFAPALTRDKWRQMVEINFHANSTVTPLTDIEIYNREEHWTLPGKYGDCEDFVLLKRQLLIDKGWPSSSLLVTVVRQQGGEGHAVLTVRTQQADFVLDNLSSKILPWYQSDYKFVKRQSTLHSGRWADIRDSRDIVASIK